MTTRVLRPEEWDKITAPGVPDLLEYCNPEDVSVIVVEEDGKIVASVCVLHVTHFEGLWIEPKHRGNAGVFRSLIRRAYDVPMSWGRSWAIGGAEDGDARMDKLCRRLGGQPLPLKFYALPVGD